MIHWLKHLPVQPYSQHQKCSEIVTWSCVIMTSCRHPCSYCVCIVCVYMLQHVQFESLKELIVRHMVLFNSYPVMDCYIFVTVLPKNVCYVVYAHYMYTLIFSHVLNIF